MKKLLVLLCVAALVLLAACTGDDGDTEPGGVLEGTNAVDPGPPEPALSDPFSAFEDGLDELGVSYERVEVAAELVGAQQGCRYLIGDGQVELYEFAQDSEGHAALQESGEIVLEGVGAFPVEVNTTLALLVDAPGNEAQVVELFHNL